MDSLLKKGDYRPINKNFLLEGHEVLEEVTKVQEKWKKGDTDTFINELRDSMAGYYLGYELVNVEKHGFDCKMNKYEDIFLEVKSASFAKKNAIKVSVLIDANDPHRAEILTIFITSKIK